MTTMAHVASPGAAGAAPSSNPRRLVVIDGGDQHWKRLTERANQLYTQGNISLARTVYIDALAEAERLFDAAIDQPGGLPVAVIYNVSCHNLAELAERTGDIRAAEIFYRKAYDRLLDTARSPTTPLATRIACVQHLKQALAVLVRHLRVAKASSPETIELIVFKARETAYSVFRIASHAKQADADCPHCPIIPS